MLRATWRHQGHIAAIRTAWVRTTIGVRLSISAAACAWGSTPAWAASSMSIMPTAEKTIWIIMSVATTPASDATHLQRCDRRG